jgi:dTDP-4-dehydrorhamnose 3,5-epimerase
MKVIETSIPDVKIIEPNVFGDERGFFYESFNKALFDEAVGRNVEFVQDNHSQSQKGVLRGLHYQLDPHAQGKLVRCIEGTVFDVAVDIRKSSTTFGQWVGVELSSQNNRQLWIPEGFAHGFVTLSDRAQFVYKTTNYYVPQSERCIIWNDVEIAVQWPVVDNIQLSAKDQKGLSLNTVELYS